MLDILGLPQDDLKRILPKASTRSLAKLVIAYPRAAGGTILNLLAACMSAATLEFVEEEMGVMHAPSYPEIRIVELELMKIIREEHLEERLFSYPPAIASPR